MHIRDRIKELRRVPASELRPNPKNWRTHPLAQRDALKGVLAEIGMADAVLARELSDGSLMLIDGHLRMETLGDAPTPVLILDVDEAEADKLLATLDPLAAMAEANAAKLDELLHAVNTSSEAVANMLAELADDAGLYQEQPEIAEDEPPEPPAEPITQPGDLWLLGPHRLLLGDSTDAESVQRLMGDDRATCVFTDPPYGVSIAAKNRMLDEVAGKNARNKTDIIDDALTPEQLKARLLPAFVNLRNHVMADDCTLFVSAPQGGELAMMMMMMMQESCLAARHVLIWRKSSPTFSMGRLDYDYQHEPILMTWGKRHKRLMAGTHKTSVWDVAKPSASKLHPTMKPVELYANAYLNHSEAGDIVADIYGGSGTAIVAAEQLGRRARVMEISPAYVDVIVQRWETLTGNKATRER